MSGLPGLRPGPVSDWLCTLGLGAQPPLRFTPLGDGKSNLIYLVTDAAGARWVLRRPPLGKLAPSAHDVAREHGVLSALSATAAPVPRVLGLSTDPAVTDAPLLVLEHIPGIVLDNEATASATPRDWRAQAGPALARTLGTLHAVDLDATGLTGLASHAPYAERQLRRWSRQWEAARTRELPLVDELARRLHEAIPPQTETTLVHGDFHLRNVIWDPDAARVNAVLDWELCTLGDPLADLGGLLAYWPRPGDDPDVPFGVSTLAGFSERDTVAQAYAHATGRSLDALAFWHALAYWKIAIIIEGVRRRALDDPRNPGAAAGFDARFVEDLLVRSAQVAGAAGF